MKTIKFTSMVFAALMLVFTSCEKEDIHPASSSGSSPSSAKSGDFTVKMTDAPGDYAALDVEIKGVDAYLENKGWVNLSNETRTLNVLSLTNGLETVLAFKAGLDAGHYSKVKLNFGDQHSLTLKAQANAGGVSGNSSTQANLIWSGPKEVIIEIDENISANTDAEILLDFQVVESIKEQAQQYIIEPVITEIKDATTGLKGNVEGTANAAIIISNGENQISTYIDTSGNFLIRGLEEGIYDMVIIPQTDNLGLVQEKRLENITVTKGEIKYVGNFKF